MEIEAKDNAYVITGLAMKEIRSDEDVAAAIQETFEKAKISTKKVNISIAGEGVVARHLSLPTMNEEELKKALIYELEDYIPFKPEEIYYDYRIMGEEPTDNKRMRVFLVATKKDVTNKKLELIKNAGLEPQLLTMDALALKNTLYFNYPEKEDIDITVLNIGDRLSNILIVKERIPYFVRDTKFGGEAITTLLQAKLELDKKAAEELKHNLQKAPSNTPNMIKSTLVTLLNEIFISLDFYENLTEQKIDELYIAGGLSQLYGLKDFLAGYLGVSIINMDPFKNFSLEPHLSREEITPLIPFFTVAIGLALEEA